MLLAEPVPSQQELDSLTNEVRRTQRECQQLEDKQNNHTDEKLAIYKQQAATASKKKEAKHEDVKKLETEKEALERLMTEKESEYMQQKGTKHMKRDDFKQYAVSLRGKNQKYRKMKKELEETRSELNVLMRTEEILKSRATDLDQFMEKLAQSKGVSGYA